MKRVFKISYFRFFSLLLILHSSFLIPNCFTQWLQQTLPVNKPITGIEFVDTLKGWACTGWGTQNDSSYILYTTNSGTNWLVQLSVYNIYFTDIDMLNALTGYTAGYDLNINRDKLFKTTDGGINWTYVTMVPNMGIDDMQFLNMDSGWECGNSIGPDVRTTTDGGNTWEIRTNGLTQPTSRIFFLNYNTGFCGAQSRLYRTTNAGSSWTLLSNFFTLVQSIFFLNANTAWIGLSPSITANVAHTTNGGINWTTQTLEPYNSNIRDIYFANLLTGWAGIASNKIYKTTNEGVNWGYQNTASGSSSVSFINALTGWIGDNTGTYTIGYTTNGGGAITYNGIVNVNNQIPKSYMLYQNYPNPFNSQTNIKIDITNNLRSQITNVKLIIYDVLGREIIVLINQQLKAGSYKVDWNAGDYSTGIYFYKLIVEGNIIDTKKMLLIK